MTESLSRHCPQCNVELLYSSSCHKLRAERNNSKCTPCSCKKSVLPRVCFRCNNEINYTNHQSRWSAERNQSLCRKCCKFYPDSKLERICPMCNIVIIYKTKNSYFHAKRKNLVCLNCKLIKREDKLKNAIPKIYYIAHPRIITPLQHHCPVCGIELKYKKRVYLKRAIKWNAKCPPCRKSMPRSDEWKSKISKGLIGKTKSDEHRRKLRIATINDLNSKYAKVYPNYNSKACQIFEQINQELNWNGQHAENGGEYQVPDLGYWVDYYEPTHNIVIEYDELRHKYHKYKRTDMCRQLEITNKMQCKFFRIRYDEPIGQIIKRLSDVHSPS